MELHEQRLDFAHHGRMGGRPWSRANVTQTLAAQIWMEHARRGDPPPHLAVRSHYHKVADSYDAHPTRVIQTPAWQLHTAYAHRVVPEELSDIGGMILAVTEDGIDVKKLTWTTNKDEKVWRKP
ncbi:MAG: hypothetical protein ACT4QE_08650, partial [Anaerolineales bacterium]